MTKTTTRISLLMGMILSLALPLTLSAQAADDRGAFLFAYKPTTTMAALTAGYKKHLEFHRENADPILWYAWQVVQGDDLNVFVDGAFDVSFAEFDNRIDPAGDRADAIKTFAPHATPYYRKVYRLREDLSTATALEDTQAGALMQVMHYTVAPNGAGAFEAYLKQIAATKLRDYTVYGLITGDDHAGYMVTTQLQNMAELADHHGDLFTLARGAGLPALTPHIAITATSELWQYRADLSHFPE